MARSTRNSDAERETVLEWLNDFPRGENDDLLLQIMRTTMRLDHDDTHRMELKMINSALKELRYAAKVFSPYRDVPKVTIFGSARTAPGEPEYQQTVKFAKKIVDLGYMVITGAGGGIMEAGHVGAGRDKSFGVNIHLPFEQSANHVIRKDHKLVNFKYFFTRKVVFIKESAAVVLFPGGFGTLDEGFETLTLLQTGKTSPIPVVLMDHPGGSYWRDWKEYVIGNVLRRGNISPEDLYLFKITEDIDEAIEDIHGFYRNYHSCRYVGGRLHLRLRHELDDEMLETIHEKFNDILVDGKFERGSPVPHEDEESYADLFALRFHFNRRNHGRLRKLIDYLNSCAPESAPGCSPPSRSLDESAAAEEEDSADTGIMRAEPPD